MLSMETLSKKEFYELSERHANPCISIYLPTHASGVEVNEKTDQITFKSILQRTSAELKDRGLDPEITANLLRPAQELVNDTSFWNNQSSGLCVFLSEGFSRVIKIPHTVHEELLINGSFSVRQLTQLVTKNTHFYLLAISKKSTRFFRGDEYSIEEMNVAGLPYNMDDVIHFEEKSGRKLFRNGGTAAGNAGNIHGHSDGLANDDEYIAQYLKEVDQTLWTEVLANEKAPLVIAGVDSLVASYKAISKYKNIISDHIGGNQDQSNSKELHKKALELVKPNFDQQCNAALKNYYDHLAGASTTSIPDKIIPASHYAQISDLFVDRNARLWGTFDEVNNKLIVHSEREHDDECLVNSAIVKTLKNGGDVYILESEKMPKSSEMAAFLRFNT